MPSSSQHKRIRTLARGALLMLAGWSAVDSAAGREPLHVRVVADETITSTRLPDNGASPLWAYGAPMLVRSGDTVWASIAVTDPEAQPYCNTHWELWRCGSEAVWRRIRSGPAATEREPCPIALIDEHTLVLSANPRVLRREESDDGISWFCQPVLPMFDLRDPADNDRVRVPAPVFNPGARFRQHSYRGLAVDKSARELLLLMIDGEDYEPTWGDAALRWHPMPVLHFPIRACYPQVVLRNRAAHVLAIGDIVEPNPAWKREKFRVLQREWDYAFRRLFYAWTPEVEKGFGTPLEIDSVEDTAGWMVNMDLLLDRSGRAHVLYFKRSIQYAFLRDRFFPGQAMTDTLIHVVIDRGRILKRETLQTRSAEPAATDSPSRQRPAMWGRLHELADGRLLVVYAMDDGASKGEGGGEAGLFLQKLNLQGGATSAPLRVPLTSTAGFLHGAFFTNTPRGGSDPGNRLDLLGGKVEQGTMTLRHVSLEIE